MKMTMKMMMVAGAVSTFAGLASAAPDQARAYAADLLSDASSRASLLADDGSSMKLYGYSQFRWMYNNRSDTEDITENSDAQDATIGFQTRYTKLGVKGDLNANWSYNVMGSFARSGGSFGLDDAWGQYRFDQGWSVRFGQFKAPGTREELVSDTNQLAFDRSVMGAAFTLGRTQGVQFAYEADQWRFRGMINDGAVELNTDIEDESADFGLTARFEYKGAGDWKQFEDFTSWQGGSGFAWMIGGAVHFQTGGSSFQSPSGKTDETDVIAYTIDGSLEGNGWNAFAAFAGSRVDPDGGTEADDFGFLIQGGLMIAPQNELFARFDTVIPDGDRSGDEGFSTLTAGWNHYFVPESHAAKLTLGASFFLDDPSQNDVVAATGANTATGLLSSADDSQFVFVAQMQLIF